MWSLWACKMKCFLICFEICGLQGGIGGNIGGNSCCYLNMHPQPLYFSKLILINAIPDKLRFGLSQWKHAQRIMMPSWDFWVRCVEFRSLTDIPMELPHAPNEGHVLCFPVYCEIIIYCRHSPRWSSWFFCPCLFAVCMSLQLAESFLQKKLQFTNGSNRQSALPQCYRESRSWVYLCISCRETSQKSPKQCHSRCHSSFP